ncbi:NAD(P)/FAD-dependent oxidoreductase [Limosilactobacillus allomucosae]|uniref:NAD(P)/FAD-dependent oxidoreductase n=1 Tax=Limosilactobacillus allomucosae TaxID=3142938 RepID=UPI0032677E00
MMEQTYDVTIVGGGPAGMFAAFYAGLHELKAQLIESLPQLGGQVAALYPEKQIWDVAGEAGVQGRELIADLKKQMAIAPVDQFLGEQVTNVVKLADGTFKIESAQRTSYSKAVVIALGNGAFSPRRLALDGADQLEGRQVRYFVSDQSDFADQRVAVLGGGDSAIDMALMLEPIAKEVHLIHRRDAFRALEHTVSQLKKSQVQVETPYLPKELRLNEDDSVGLTLKKMRSDEEKHLEVDKILVNYGFTSNNAALNEWELPLASERGLIKVDSKMETSVPGVYAIGDGVTYPGKAALIAVGFGEAPIAITALAKALYPKKRMATHSSSMHIDSQHK